jgi:hypothetical protein
MSIGGLLARMALLKEQLKSKPCVRCHQLYDPTTLEKCPHCGELDDADLLQYIEQLESEHLGNRKLGMWFLTAMLVVGFIMLVLAGV